MSTDDASFDPIALIEVRPSKKIMPSAGGDPLGAKAAEVGSLH